MKVHAQNSGRYINPRKQRRLTAAERRGLEMVKGCRLAEPYEEGRPWSR